MQSLRVPLRLCSSLCWTRAHAALPSPPPYCPAVIAGASELRVTLLDQSTFKAKVLGFDPDKDVAVLQLHDLTPEQAKALRPVQLWSGASDNLLVGQKVSMH